MSTDFIIISLKNFGMGLLWVYYRSIRR